MVAVLPLFAGVMLAVVAVGGLLEVTNYTEQQRRDERRLVQAFTYGCLLMLPFAAVAVWTGIQGGRLPGWLFVGSSLLVAGTVVAQRKLRQAFE